MYFADIAEIERALASKELEIQSRITVRLTEYETTAVDGEFEAKPFVWKQPLAVLYCRKFYRKVCLSKRLTVALKKKEISKPIDESFRRCGLKETVVFGDKLMQNGYALQPVQVFHSALMTC